MTHRAPRRSRGVSLIEALVALAVMAFGMLAVAGMQATMRLNADIAKQRSEAVRIAQEAMELWRGFAVMPSTADVVDYADLVTVAAEAVPGYTTNTTYQLARGVADRPELGRKNLQIDVSWTDRTGTLQSVQLNSIVAAVAPEVAATLSVPSPGAPTRMPRGRSVAIPLQARDFGDGSSGYRPPQPSGGTVGWVFSNVSGLVTQVCTLPAGASNSTLQASDLTACTATTAQVVSGYVRFDPSAPPTAVSAENPTGTAMNLDVVLTLTSSGHPSAPVCFDDAPTTLPTVSTVVGYTCLVHANTAQRWSGLSTIVPIGWDVAPTGLYKVCRYTPTASESPANPLHPRQYVDVRPQEQIVNQNFLVIASAWSCPTDGPVDPLSSPPNYVNGNTLQHQPAPA